MDPDQKQPELDDHGQEVVKPRFGLDSPLKEPESGGRGVYDQEPPRPEKAHDAQSADRLADREASAASGADNPAEASEQKALDKQKDESTPDGEESPRSGRFSRFRPRVRLSRRQAAGGVAIFAFGAMGFGGFAILQGPFQLIHFAQNLQHHFRPNEETGNDRTSKILLYALTGKGAQNGRLGVMGNAVANKWEKKLLQETGMRPVYQEPGRRFVGFEIVDENKAHDFLGDVGNQEGRNARKLERVMGNGAEISDGTDKIVNGSEEKLNGKKFVDLRNVSFGDRRTFIRSVGKATGTRNISSSIGSRILIKRAGVNFHPLNKIKKRTDESIAKFYEKRDKDISEGVESTDDVKPGQSDTDGDGDEDGPSGEDVKASDETKSYIDDFKKSGAFKTATSSAIVVGLMCAVKSYGDQIEDFKYQNNVLPMMRLGMLDMTGGNQVMALDGSFDLESIRLATEYFYDKEKKTSAQQAESIRANQGKTGGTPIPPEADLRNATDKPLFFDVVDDIPFLGTACAIQSGILGLPVIKQVSSIASSAVETAINGVAGIFNTSTEEIMESSLKVVSGKSVDPRAKGAPHGSYADTGVFLAANEQATGNAGRALSPEERAAVVAYTNQIDREDFAEKPALARYFNPLDSRSLAGKAIDASPSSTTEMVASISNPFKTISSAVSKTFSAINPKASAAITYDYGTPMVGHSLAERANDLYENPYENATREITVDGKPLKLEDDLPRLNEMYGKPCFGVEVTVDDKGPHVKQSEEKVNVFKVQKEHPECDPTTNHDDRFNQYRFYIIDANTVISLACYDGDEDACSEMGIGSGAGSTGSTPLSGEGGERIKNVAEAEYRKNGNKQLETCGENCGPEVQKYTGGPSGPSAPWCAWFVSWVYREAGYEFKGAPAGADGNIPSVSNLIAWFKQHGIHFTPSSSEYKPEPGDVIMYGGGAHTGIVVYREGDNIETIEGNTSGDGSYNANGETVGRKKFNYKTYTSRTIEFGRLKSF